MKKFARNFVKSLPVFPVQLATAGSENWHLQPGSKQRNFSFQFTDNRQKSFLREVSAIPITGRMTQRSIVPKAISSPCPVPKNFLKTAPV